MDSISRFKTIGICGGGKMGVSFFNYISKFDFNIVFYIRNSEKREKINRSYFRNFMTKQKNGDIEVSDIPNVVITGNIEELGDSDIIFEFVAEDLNVKRKVIEALISVSRNPEQIIASGSSSMTPGMLHKDYSKHNIIGVHYFYPVQYLKTVEVFYGAGTDKSVIEKVCCFLDSIDKKRLLLGEEAGALIIRVFSGMQNEAFKVFKHNNIDPGEIDRLIEKENFAMPPFDLIDSVGFEIISNCIEALYGGSDEYEYHKEMKDYLEIQMLNGWLGKKSGRGFFDYTGGSRKSSGEYGTVGESVLREEIVDRLKMMYLNSCFSLLNDCWVNTDELDTALCEINQCDKGPVEIAYEYGMTKILEKLEGCSSRYGIHFKPPEIVRYIVKNGIGRDEIDRQIRLFNMGETRPDWYNEDFRKKRKCLAEA